MNKNVFGYIQLNHYIVDINMINCTELAEKSGDNEFWTIKLKVTEKDEG